MIFRISVGDMKKAVSLIRDIVPGKSITQEGAGILISADKATNSILFTAVGSDIVLQFTASDCSVEEPGVVVVNSGLLSGAVVSFTPNTGEAGTSDLDFQLSNKNRTLVITSKTLYKSGKSVKHKRSIPILNSGLFPALPKVDNENSYDLVVPGHVLASAFDSVLYAVSSAPDAGITGGIFMSVSSGELLCASTDRVRLAEYKAAVDKKASFSTVITPKFASKVTKCVQPAESVSIKKTTNMLWIRTADVLIGGVVLLGSFPDYKSFLLTDCKEATVDKELFLDNIRNLDYVDVEENRVNLKIREGLLHISTPYAENDGIPIDLKDNVKIDFNIKLLKSTVQAVPGTHIVFGYSGEETVAFFRAADPNQPGSSFRAVLMPMRQLGA